MRHIKVLSRRPAEAQFEPMLQFVGLIAAIIGLIENINRAFNTNFLQKEAEE